MASMQQQEKMKNHISRLTQLNSSKGSEESLSRLEDALAQSQAENKQLRTKIALLENQTREVIVEVPVSGDMDESALVQNLRIRISQQAEELASLKKELRTSQMLKLSETEKLRHCEACLHDSEQEIERLKRVVAQLKFHLEERKISQEVERNTANNPPPPPQQHPTAAVVPVAPAPKMDTPVAAPGKRPRSPSPQRLELTFDEGDLEASADVNQERKRVKIEDAGEQQVEEDKENTEAWVPPKVAEGTPRVAHQHGQQQPPSYVHGPPPPSAPKQIYVKRSNVNECNQQ